MSDSSSDGVHMVGEKEKGPHAAVVGAEPKNEAEAYVTAGDAMALLDLVSTESPYHPIHWPLWQRWGLTIIYCSLQMFVTILSTDYLSVEYLIQEMFGCSTQIVTLGQAENGSTNLPMLIIFMFLSGLTGSVALCNVAGTIADLFGDDPGAGQAMALFVSSANIGPSIGSPIAYAIGMAFLPETLPRLVIAKAAKGEHGDQVAEVLATTRVSVMKETIFCLTMALKIMVTEPVIIALGLYNGFAYGLLFLYLDGVFDVFVFNNNLSYIAADLSFLNFVVGVMIMFCFFVPLQTWLIRRDRAKRGGAVRPEARFLLSLVTVWGFPISLFWFAFTSNGKTSYWSPICAGALLGIVDPLLWMSMLNYITDSYPNVAGSAIAAFLIPSFLIAAGCAHAGVAMFEKLSTTVAFAILGGISVGVVALGRKGILQNMPGTRDRQDKGSKARQEGLVARREERDAIAAAVEAAADSHTLASGRRDVESSEVDQPSSEQVRASEVERELREERAKVQSLEDEIFAAKNRQTRLQADLKHAQDLLDSVDPLSTIIRPEHQIVIDGLAAKVAAVSKQAQLAVLDKERLVVMNENERMEQEVAKLEALVAKNASEDKMAEEEPVQESPEPEPVGKKAKAAAKKELAALAALERKAASLPSVEEEVARLKALIEESTAAKNQMLVVQEHLDREQKELQRLEQLAAAKPMKASTPPPNEEELALARKIESLSAKIAELEGERERGEWEGALDDPQTKAFSPSQSSEASRGGSEEHDFAVGQLIQTIKNLNEATASLRSENTALLLQMTGVGA
ncbi:hypothetical protein RQP46_005793 [Phenoliferia psychrophenolica]